MPYYDDTVNKFLVNGKTVMMTEEQAEDYQERYPLANLVSDTDIPAPFPDEAADDYLDCTCPDDPPNNVTATLCASCRAYFASLEN